MAVRFWVRIYRALLYLYPAAARAETGRDLLELFEDLLTDPANRGFLTTSKIVVATFADLPISAYRARREARAIAIQNSGFRPGYLRADMRLAMRSLNKHRTYALASILTLALGIGSNTAVFSVVRSVLLKPLPYAVPEQLLILWNEGDAVEGRLALSPPSVPEMAARVPSFQDVGAAWSTQTNLLSERGAVRVSMSWTTPNFFDLLGVSPILGRSFRAEDESWFDPSLLNIRDFRPRPAPVLLAHRIWVDEFDADNGVIGRQIQLNGQITEVVGVLPPDFEMLLPAGEILPRFTDVWAVFPINPATQPRDEHNVTVLARLADDATKDDVRAELSELSRWQRASFAHDASLGLSIAFSPLRAEVVKNVRPVLLLLWGSVTFVLLVACANVANLGLARGAVRQNEFAVRVTLGAGRGRLITQVLAESFLISLAGTLSGLFVAVWGIEALLQLQPRGIPRFDAIGVDVGVLVFTAASTVFVALLSGIAPAIRASRTKGSITPCQHTTTNTAGARMRRILIVFEVASSLVLLIGAGLMLQTFRELRRVDPGFEPRGVMVSDVALPFFGFLDPNVRVLFWNNLLADLRAFPEFAASGAAVGAPLSPEGDVFPARFALPEGRGEATGQLRLHPVFPGFLETLRTTVVDGRLIAQDDLNPDAEPVAVVTASTASRLWPDSDPVGEELILHQDEDADTAGTRTTVIGVVADVLYSTLPGQSNADIFVPYPTLRWSEVTIVVRSDADVATLNSILRREVEKQSDAATMTSFEPLEVNVSVALAPVKFTSAAISVFSFIALLLAAIGMYGLFSFMATIVTREIGVRIAFGAPRRTIVRMVVWQGLRLTAIGLALGLGTSVLLARTLDRVLYGVAPTDPLIYGALATLLTAVALMATYLPARRASRIDPSEALRYD